MPGAAEPTYGTAKTLGGQPPGGEGHELIGTPPVLQEDRPVRVLPRVYDGSTRLGVVVAGKEPR